MTVDSTFYDDIERFIAAYTADHGYPPSVGEIGKRIGRSKSTTHHHLARMAAEGRIVRTPGISRGVRLAGRSKPNGA